MHNGLTLLGVALTLVAAIDAAAFPLPPGGHRGRQYVYASESSCRLAAKISAEQCANAVANARAEFDEKAPRFSSREACERIFARAGCSVGLEGAAGWSGKKSGVFFQPRQSGFVVNAISEREITVSPQALGPAIGFSNRTAMRRDTRIDQRLVRQRDAWAPATAGGAGAVYGVDVPTGSAGPLPPLSPVDPNFDCASVLEPDAKGDPATGCYPAPLRR